MKRILVLTSLLEVLWHLGASENGIAENGHSERHPPSVLAEQGSPSPRLRLYRGPLPKLPAAVDSPWIALHSPVRMYIPIRYTGNSTAESPDCVQCPRNFTVHLPSRHKTIQTPVPTLSICSSLARRPGRVHVAVASGPRPGQQLPEGVYPVELIVWKADGPVHSCQYMFTVQDRKRGKAYSRCSRPASPPGGVLLCDPDDGHLPSLPPNSVCQSFCSEGFGNDSSIVVCSEGRWTPEYRNLSCVDTSCPAPDSPTQGSWDCDKRKKAGRFADGTRCRIRCRKGFVVPTSRLDEAVILCTGGRWNLSDPTQRCKRAHLPKLSRCKNRHIVVSAGDALTLSEDYFPIFTSHAGRVLASECTLPRGMNLSSGQKQNECVAKDPELRTRKKCRYRISIEERHVPRPVSGDCENRTVLANHDGSYRLESVRFEVVLDGGPAVDVLRANCSPEGELEVGDHSIHCEALDSATGILGSCDFSVIVQGITCEPLPTTANGNVTCNTTKEGLLSPQTRCSMQCEAGYWTGGVTAITCSDDLDWIPPSLSDCEPVPRLLRGCDDRELQASVPVDVAVPLPEFLTYGNESAPVTCIPHSITDVGEYLVTCTTDGNASCEFTVLVVPDEPDASSTTIAVEKIPRLLTGCEDREFRASVPVDVAVPLPEFLRYTNESAPVTCDPHRITDVGDQLVTCTTDGNASCQFTVVVVPDPSSTTITIEGRPCVPPEAPLHGSVVCSVQDPDKEVCDVTCDEGYGFSGGELVLRLECSLGTWNFQGEELDNDTLSECLVQLESSAVELWMSFDAVSRHCDEEFEGRVEALVQEFCHQGTECLPPRVNCTLDEEKDTMLVSVNWTVQADFEPENYMDEEVPEAETRLESALDRVRTFVAEGDRDSDLLTPVRDSFRRGLMTLVCPDGFVANMLLAICVK